MILGENPGSKLNKAKKLNTPIINQQDLTSLLEGNMPGINALGEILSLGSAVTWGISVSLFKIIGNSVSPYILNPLKNTIGTILFILTTLLISDISAVNSLSTNETLILALSGIIGITIADVLFLISLNILGTSRSSIINTIYSPMVIMLAYFILDESLTFADVIGGLMILLSILYLSFNQEKSNINNLNKGLLIGILAYSLMALGIIMVKPILNRFSNSIEMQLWIIVFRLIPGTLLSYVNELYDKEKGNYFTII